MTAVVPSEDGSTAVYTVAVRDLCEFTAKVGSLDLRFTPTPTALQGILGHQLVAQRRGPDHETEVKLSGQHQELRVVGRCDGYNAQRNELEEVKTYRGSLEAMAENHRLLHWAQAKVYGALMCQSRGLADITLTVVYFDVISQTESPETEVFTAPALQQFFEAQCTTFLVWAREELAHRRDRDRHLEALAFPQLPFRAGQRALASAVYRACTQSHTLRAQAPTGIGKTMGTLFPALKAMPVRGLDKLFFLSAKTPGRQVALDALAKLGLPASSDHPFPIRVVELVARDKSCEHKDKACHGESCPLANGFYDKLPQAREAAAQVRWLDRTQLRAVALAHAVCPYYLGQEMVRWADVVVGDYNHYFDRSAMLYALTLTQDWKVSVLVDEAHNLYSRACSMYSADLSQAEAMAVRPHVTAGIRNRLDALLNEWQLLLDGQARQAPGTDWHLINELPEDWVRALQKLNSAIGEHLNNHPTQAHGPVLPFYFRTLGFAGLADTLGDHSLCELDTSNLGLADAAAGTPEEATTSHQLSLDPGALQTAEWAPGKLTLRNIVPATFLLPRIQAADSLVLFSATLSPQDYDQNLLGLPDNTRHLDVPSPFSPDQLQVTVLPISTRITDRDRTLDTLVDAMTVQYAAKPGNYLAFFSSFDYLQKAQQRLQQRHPDIPTWSQARTMDEPSRQQFLDRFSVAGQGVGFAVLGGVFGEGVDLPGSRLIGAFIATMGFPQFDRVSEAIRARMEEKFGRGYDYTYVYPGIQKVVQAAGRVIRTETDTGTVMLMDRRYGDPRYRGLLPAAWRAGNVRRD